MPCCGKQRLVYRRGPRRLVQRGCELGGGEEPGRGLWQRPVPSEWQADPEQIIVILYRYAHEENTEDGKLTSFPDAKDISGYALEAMNWAVARGLINGSDGKLLPQDTATRAQIAVILARYLNA